MRVSPDLRFDPGHVCRDRCAGISPFRATPALEDIVVARFLSLGPHHASVFLHPFAPPGLTGFIANMGALTPVRRFFASLSGIMNAVLTSAQVSLLHVSGLPTLPSPTTWLGPVIALTRNPSASRASRSRRFGLHPWLAGSPSGPAESSSLSYGRVVRLRLLSTLPRGNAVFFGYRPECACLKRTYTLLTKHTYRRTSRGIYPPVSGA